jgi:RNA polymerase subunit RPABC4/transcription elongation factor Spt4
LKRYWFVSLILWSNLIGNGIYALISIFYVHFIFCIIFIPAIIACILLLNWKIIGFYIYCITFFSNIFFNLIFGEDVLFSIITFIIQIIILYGILNIKKEGISTWDYMKNNNLILLEDNINKKCSSCGTLYSKIFNTCPNCGSSIFLLNEKQKENISNNDINVEKKRCKKCNTFVSSDTFKCSKCGGESFI